MDALNDSGVIRRFKVRVKTVKDVNLSFQENCSIEMTKDISRNDNRFILITPPNLVREGVLEMVLVGSETTIEKGLSFELLLFLFRSESLFVCESFDHLRVIVGRLPKEVDLLVR